MRIQRLTELGIIRGYKRLNSKMVEVQTDLHQAISMLTKPVRISENERLVLLNLPSHLIKTYFTLKTLGHASADTVSVQTGKSRANESSCLNQLVTMGFCRKQREKRRAIFIVNQDVEQTCNS